MSWEIENIKEISCLCGKGKIILKSESNDWNNTRKNVYIDCEDCNKRYDIVKEVSVPKPKHEIEIYYCVKKNNKNNKIKLEI